MTMNCSHNCLNNGVCATNNTCICATCFTGLSCEINVNAHENSLFALILWDTQQADAIGGFNWSKFAYIVVITSMLILSLINNLSSLQTFMLYEIRKTNCGIYQILFSLAGMITLTALELRLMTTLWFDNLTEAYIYRYIACNILPVIDKVMGNFCLGVSELLSIEIVLLECFNLNLYRSRWLSVILSTLVFIAMFSLRINVFIYRRPSPNPHRLGSYICKYIHPLHIESLDKVYFIIQTVLPISIHFLAGLCILLSITKRAGFLFNRHDFRRIFFEQCFKRKHFFVLAIVIIIANTPLMILHLQDGCEDIRNLSTLRRHAAFSLLTYLPESMTFFIYIYPSASYMHCFKKTWLAKVLYKQPSRHYRKSIAQ